MTASIVRIEEVIKHPNADRLNIYKVSNDLDIKSVQVIANEENLYKEGDHAVYIYVNSTLLDGTKIKKRKIRDYISCGMLAGLSNKEVGKDVTEEWCKKEEAPLNIQRTNLKHQKWPSIESLAHVNRYIKSQLKINIIAKQYDMTYASKVKLHGTNAGIQISKEGEVVAQKRSSVIYPDQDNVGFATWVFQNKNYFEELKREDNITLHGEWFGPNIQKGVACSKLSEKQFAIYAIQIKDNTDINHKLIIEPKEIEEIIGSTGPCYILPWHSEIYLNFCDQNQLSIAASKITNSVLEVEKCDPFIKDVFNIEGIGEGLVFYPKFNKAEPKFARNITPFIFKVKGELHQSNVHKKKELTPIEIERLNSINEFTNKFISKSRLEQGVVEACMGNYDIKFIGTFLKWILNDVKKESKAELNETEFKWKEISKSLSSKASLWYKNKIYEKYEKD